MKRIISLLLSLLLVFSLALPAQASSVTVDKDSEGNKFINLWHIGGNKHTGTDLFTSEAFKSLMPGDTVYQTITISSGFPFDEDTLAFYLQAIPHDAGNLPLDPHIQSLDVMNKFLSYITITVWNTKSDVPLFVGPANAATDSIFLGEFRRGGKIELLVKLEVDIAMPNYLTDAQGNILTDEKGNPYKFTDACGEIDWILSVEAFDDPAYDNPKTGDVIMIAVAVMTVSGAALIFLLVSKKKRRS